MKPCYPCVCCIAAAFLFGDISRADILATNLLLNPGAETGDLTHWVAEGTSNPFVDNGSFNSGLNPHSGNFHFAGGVGLSGTLTQNISLIGNQGLTAEMIDSGSLWAIASFWVQNIDEGDPSDEAGVTIKFFNASNVPSPTRTLRIMEKGPWRRYSHPQQIPAGTRTIDYIMYFDRRVGTQLDSYLDDNELIIVSDTIPTLKIASAGTNMVLSWPTETINFVLEAATQLTSTNVISNWVWVTNSPTVIGADYVVTNSAPETRFFRLRRNQF
ncbi:MAG: hypothetical protein H0X66_14215 [Verrucomicrobia bacterium]|nr:hypothetical protein [Verrucomicrobiota bacterium]